MRRSLSCILSLLYVVISHATLHSSIPTVQLDRSIKNLDFSSLKIAFYSDSTEMISIDRVRRDTAALQIMNGNTIFPSSPDHKWLAFVLHKQGDDSFRNFILQFGNAHISDYTIYFYDQVGLIEKTTQGDSYNFAQRQVRHNFFVHNLPDISSDELQVFIKIDQSGHELNFPINIFERNYFIQHTLRVKIFHGLIIGLFLITSIVTLFLYFIYKQAFFLYEVIVSIASILYILSEEGYGMMLLWPDSPFTNALSRPLSVGIVVIFSLFFTLSLLNTYKRQRTHYYISMVVVVVYVGFMIMAHPIDLCIIRNEDNIGTIVSIFLAGTIMVCLAIVLLSLRAWLKEKSTDGMVIFLVFAVTLISVAIRFLAMQGLGPSTDLVQHTGFITRGVHIPLIGGYLIYSALKSFKESQQIKIELLEERNKTTQAVIEKIDAERQRISMALHDSAGSIITGLKANLQMVKDDFSSIDQDVHYKETLKLSDQLQQEIRNISNDLLPSSILKLGLVEEIKKILHNLEKTYGITTSLESNGQANESIDSKIVFHLYYIIREALDNIVKYADAKNILIQYFKYDDEIHLVIEDDGKGFDITSAKEKGGNGLKNLALRVSWLNGDIDIYSQGGTSISINVPIIVDQSRSM